VSHLTEPERAELGAELQRQLERLERSMKVTELAARPVELDQTAVGRLSRMDSLQSQGMTKNLQDREQIRLALILQALGRFEEGTYGVCQECGVPVQFGRLLVYPEAPNCAGCGHGP
jgi:DnaK suppressor protein